MTTGSDQSGGVEPRLLYRYVEVTAILSISRSQLYRLISQGEIQTIKLGKSSRISGAQLRAFVERLEESPHLRIIR